MKSLSRLGIFGVAVALAGGAWAQDNSGLKARELFYTPPPAETPAKPAPANKISPKRASAAQHQSSATEATKSAPKAPASTEAAKTAPAPAAAAPHTVAVAAVPLGVRYSVLKRDGAGEFVEVDPDTTFHSGDRIRLQVKANTTGYLYVVAQGSSGSWQVLFPSSDVAGGSNLLQPGDSRQIPSGGRGQFVFDDQGGTEKLFLVLSRQAEPDLDKLIYAVGGAAPAGQGASRTLLAKASVTNDVIERLRSQVASRDLVFEKDPEVGGKVENAAYVVNPSTSPDARLVVDVNLKHQ